MIVSNYFLRKKINALVVSQAWKKTIFPSWNEIKDVLVVYSFKDIVSVEPCVNRLISMNKKVKRLIFVEDSKAVLSQDSQIVYVRKKDLNAFGFPSETAINNVSALKADILIDLSLGYCFPLIYLELLNTSVLKVGPKRDDKTYYDFTIDVQKEKDVLFLLDQVIFYAKQFGK